MRLSKDPTDCILIRTTPGSEDNFLLASMDKDLLDRIKAIFEVIKEPGRKIGIFKIAMLEFASFVTLKEEDIDEEIITELQEKGHVFIKEEEDIINDSVNSYIEELVVDEFREIHWRSYYGDKLNRTYYINIKELEAAYSTIQENKI